MFYSGKKVFKWSGIYYELKFICNVVNPDPRDSGVNGSKELNLTRIEIDVVSQTA